MSLIGISDFNPISAQPYAHHPLASTSNRPGRRWRIKRGSFGGSADRSGMLPGSTLAPSPHDDSSTVSSLSLPVGYPFGGGAATLRNMLPNAAASDALRPAAASNSAHVSPAVRRSSPSAAANSSATNSRSSSAMLIVARGSPGYRRSRSTTNALHSPGTDDRKDGSKVTRDP